MPTTLRRPAAPTIKVEALTPSVFAAFGTVIQNPTRASFPTSPSAIEANQGSATKYVDISPLISAYGLSSSAGTAAPKLTMFTCRPRLLLRNKQGEQVFDVNILERHPFTPQTFIPLGLAADDKQTAYLVIVAPTLPVTEAAAIDHQLRSRPLSLPRMNAIAQSTATPRSSGLPDLDNLKAFIARGDQAVTYGSGTWHAPMVVLGKQSVDFVVIQYTNGIGADDCQETEMYDGCLDVLIEDDLIARPSSRSRL